MTLSLTKLPWHVQLACFVLVSGLTVGAFYYFHVMGVEAELATREAQLESLRTDLRKAQLNARRLPEFKEQIGELEARLEGLKAVLPEQKDVADLLRRIQTLATQSSLTIRGFRPQPIATKQMHAEWPIVLELDGTYHNLGYFFDKISKFSRIINISGIDIRATDRPNDTYTITAECMATTFVLLDAAQAPAATGAAGAAQATRNP
jgi:type IV pilus assembly protein PilO